MKNRQELRSGEQVKQQLCFGFMTIPVELFLVFFSSLSSCLHTCTHTRHIAAQECHKTAQVVHTSALEFFKILENPCTHSEVGVEVARHPVASNDLTLLGILLLICVVRNPITIIVYDWELYYCYCIFVLSGILLLSLSMIGNRVILYLCCQG